jgi:peptidoglycan/xylan/chitin deacetylase (PgdA/CDA1 family)
VYLTFDDGPSENTRAILDVLKEYDVKATFFVTGQQALSHPERYREIAAEGHTLGMHSYSHKYSEIYETVDSFGEDLLMLQSFLEDTTGITPIFYRFPGGSSNTVSEMPMSQLCDYLTDNGITYFDWNVSSKDAVSPMRPAQEIVKNCTQNLENFDNAVILLHDAANKTSTVDALPEIIEYITAMENTEILPITEETVAIHH